MPHNELWYIKLFYAYATKDDAHSHTEGTIIDRTVLSVPTSKIRLDELGLTSIVSLCLIFSLAWIAILATLWASKSFRVPLSDSLSRPILRHHRQ